jgi:hypothetical protein
MQTTSLGIQRNHFLKKIVKKILVSGLSCLPQETELYYRIVKVKNLKPRSEENEEKGNSPTHQNIFPLILCMVGVEHAFQEL